MEKWSGAQTFFRLVLSGKHSVRAAHGSGCVAAGLPVPAAGEILQINGRYGLLCERVSGQNMWEVLEKQPWQFFTLARLAAQLHSEIHANTLGPGLPPQRRRLEHKINIAELLTGSSRCALPGSLKTSALATLSALSDGKQICHGDFHPGNILLTPGHTVVIDWIDASRGNPLANVARTTIIALGALASSEISNAALKVFVRLFHSIYLHHYFQLRPGGEEEYQRWLTVVAAARLSENIPELEHWLLHQAEKVL